MGTLTACMHLTFLGKQGLVEVATRCLQSSEYAKQRLAAAGYSLAYDQPTFNEFAVQLPAPAADVISKLRETKDIQAGYDLGRDDDALANQLLVAVTEKHTREDIDQFVQALKEAVAALDLSLIHI